MTRYEIIRIIIGLIAAIVIFMIFADKAKKKARTFALILGCLATFVVTSDTFNYIPIENLFKSFDTVEEAFYYQHREHIHIYDTFDYDDYTMVVVSGDKYEDTGIKYHVLPRSEGKWKLDSVFYQRMDGIVEGESCIVRVIKIPKNNDCFLVITGHAEDLPFEQFFVTTDNIRDSRNTEFQKLEYTDTLVMYYALIEDLDSDYVLYVDDIPISID